MKEEHSVINALIVAGDWDQVFLRLSSLQYVEARASAGLIFDLVAEYNAAAAAIPQTHEDPESYL